MSTMKRFSPRCSRRRFVAGLLGTVGLPILIPRGVLGAEGKPGANAKIRVGAIGVGHRASLLLDQLPEDAQLVALCDCNLPRAEDFKAKRKGAWPVVQDHRKLLDRHDIDAVIVGTGEFQRVLPCIHACQAGKDVYAEKPLTLYIQEGRALVEAVRRHGRVLQVGSQQRSMAMNRIACELVRTGGLGKLLEVRAVNYTNSAASPKSPSPSSPCPRGSIGTAGSTRGPTAVQFPMDGLDALAGIQRRRDDQLGPPRRGSDPVGPGRG